MASQTPQRKDIQALAENILELTKTYDPEAESSNLEPQLITKSKELIAAVQRPRDLATSVLKSVLEGSTMRTLLSLNAIQTIPDTGSISLQDLESKTGAQASLLQRLLRAVVQAGIVNQNADGTYSHTPFSIAFAQDQENVATLFSYMFDEAIILTGFAEYFRQRGAKEPEGELATTHNPRTWYYGQEGKTVFEILEQDPVKLEGFQKLMVMATRFRPFTGFYDFGKLATADHDRPVLVDVGGADGTTVSKILEAHPEIKPDQCIVQDRESVVELARKNTSLPSGVHVQAHDFFTSQPVKGARAYLLRAVCHDWSDTSVISILSHLSAAAAEDSKVLIADVVLPSGPVSGMAVFMDLGMLCIGGKERTREDFEKVLDAAGLKLDGIYPAGYESGFSIVEASRK